MKLDYKKTICVGFAFFLICMFWQVYDTLVPVILTNKFGMSQAWSGFVMALDNIFALVLLPFLGALSDKCGSRYGRRTPFIVIGTVISAFALFGLSFIDKLQLSKLSALDKTLPEGERWAYAWEQTVKEPGTLILFLAALLICLLSMAFFRSPAVALMPDVTVKPLRSKANAVINLTGTAGGMVVLALGIVFGTGKDDYMSYTLFFGIIALLMLLSLAAFLLTVKEPELVRKMQEDSIRYGIVEEEAVAADAAPASTKLTREARLSLILILLSVAFWYMGYNAATTKWSVYAKGLGIDFNSTLLIAQAAAIVTYLPCGIISSKIGRKKSILAGVALLAASFIAISFLNAGSSSFLGNLFFCLAGIGWAVINVNSFPMAVELAGAGDQGRYTGYYYTASMAAQIATPILSGVLMDLNMRTLFPYSAFFVCLSFVTMLFVKYGDNRVTDLPAAASDEAPASAAEEETV